MLIVNLPRESIHHALWLTKGYQVFASGAINQLIESFQATASRSRSDKPRALTHTRAGRTDLEHSQATASKHWSPHSVRVRVGWSALGLLSFAWFSSFGVIKRDQSWRSCYTSSDGKNNNSQAYIYHSMNKKKWPTYFFSWRAASRCSKACLYKVSRKNIRRTVCVGPILSQI